MAATFALKLAVVAVLLSFISARRNCPECNKHLCQQPRNCGAGEVWDSCGCCRECAREEHERCEHPRVYSAVHNGKCGDNLECRLRTDLGPRDALQAVCYCTLQGEICGTDGKTYANSCQFSAAKVKSGGSLEMQTKGPCGLAPEIITPPDNAKDQEGENVALACEARGHPSPTVEWTRTKADGTIDTLPSDDLHISTNMRGGPERHYVTGWLQIMDMKESHEGDYTCVVQNDLGIAKASARVNVVNAKANYLDSSKRYDNDLKERFTKFFRRDSAQERHRYH